MKALRSTIIIKEINSRENINGLSLGNIEPNTIIGEVISFGSNISNAVKIGDKVSVMIDGLSYFDFKGESYFITRINNVNYKF